MKHKIMVVGATMPSGCEGEYKRSCEICHAPTYFTDQWNEDKYKFICSNCFMNIGGEIEVTDQTANKFGIPKKLLKEFAEEIFKFRGEVG